MIEFVLLSLIILRFYCYFKQLLIISYISGCLQPERCCLPLHPTVTVFAIPTSRTHRGSLPPTWPESSSGPGASHGLRLSYMDSQQDFPDSPLECIYVCHQDQQRRRGLAQPFEQPRCHQGSGALLSPCERTVPWGVRHPPSVAADHRGEAGTLPAKEDKTGTGQDISVLGPVFQPWDQCQ